MERETPGQSLDLYSGLEAEPRTAADTTPRARDEAAPRASEDWIALLWRGFPDAVQQRYRPIDVAGEGGMGIVLEAHDTLLDRRVAVKGPRDPERAAAEWRARLGREARIHARLAHPNILPVFDAWTDARGLPWCAMLFVSADGGRFPTLSAWLAELAAAPPAEHPVAVLVEVFLQVCRGVAHAHRTGVLHRDLKPANVLLGPSGEALVADWGVAAPLPLEGGPELVGTPGYAAPEQIGQRGVPTSSVRSDVYSLGVMLREMLPAPAPRELAAIADRAAAPAPEDRHESVDALQAAIQTYLQGGLVEGLDYSRAERFVRWCRARPGLVAALATALVCGAVSVAGLTAQLRQARKNLAQSHAGWAAARGAEDRRDEARVFAALAYRTREESGADWSFHDPTVNAILASHTLPGPLVWAADIGEPATLDRGVSFVRLSDGDRLTAVTVSGRVLEATLRAPVAVHDQRLGLKQRWMVAMSRANDVMITNGPVPPAMVHRRGATGWERLCELPQTRGPTALSADGHLVAYAEERGTIHLLGLPDRTPRGDLHAATDHLMIVRFSPDGARLVCADSAGGAWIFDVAGRESPVVCERAATVVLDVGWLPDGRGVAGVGGDPAPWVWDAATGRRTSLHADARQKACYALSVSPDGHWLAAGGQDFTVRVWDLTGRQESATLSGHTDGILALSFAPDSRTLASGSQDGTIRVWDAGGAADREGRRPRPDTAIARLALSPDGSALACSGPDAVVTVASVPGLQPRMRTAVPVPPAALAFDSAGRPLTAWYAGDALYVADATRAVTPTAPLVHGVDAPLLGRDANAIATSAESRLLAVALTGERFALVELPSGPAHELPAPPGGVRGFAFAAGGGLVAAGGAHADVWLYAHGTGGWAPSRHIPPVANQEVRGLAFDATGALLGVGSEDSSAHILETSSGRERRMVQMIGPVHSLALSVERDRLLLAGPVGLSGVRLSDGALLPDLQIPSEPFWGLALVPGARYVAFLRSGDPNVWDLDAAADPAARVREILDDALFGATPDGGRLPIPGLAEARRVHPSLVR